METKQTENRQNSRDLAKDQAFSWVLFGQLGIEFGVIIAAPLLFFVFLGPIFELVGLNSAAQWANHNRHNNQWYRLTGLLASIFVSFYAILKKILSIKKLIDAKTSSRL